jgi:uncharacterized protein (DUF1697 family)
MRSTANDKRMVAFLRGINVGGHHKVPMVQLKQVFSEAGFTQITTVLNSGNIIFDLPENMDAVSDIYLEKILMAAFGFSITVVCVSASALADLIHMNPFKNEILTQNTRWYVTFLKKEPQKKLTMPWSSADGSFRIFKIKNTVVFSVLDLEVTQTPRGMEMLEQFFGKDITTRNWNTVEKLKPYC